MATTLRTKLIRLAHKNPSLRPHLLPLLTKKAADRAKMTVDTLTTEQPDGKVTLFTRDMAKNVSALKAKGPEAIMAYLKKTHPKSSGFEYDTITGQVFAEGGPTPHTLQFD